MIGTKYTSGLLAELAKMPHVRSMEIPATPDGQWVSAFTMRYTDGWDCKTTLFDDGDAVSVIEETHTGVDTITSFFEDETSCEPWLVIVEPD